MKRYLVAIALLASCEGRCNYTGGSARASRDTIGAGADCTGDNDRVMCTAGDRVYACSIDGTFYLTARCQWLGVLGPVPAEAH